MFWHEHPDEDHLELFLLNQLSDPESACIEDHLLVCSQCVDACQETARWVDCIRAALRWVDQPALADSAKGPVAVSALSATSRPLMLRWWSCAAATVLLTALTVNSIHDEQERGNVSTPVSLPARAPQVKKLLEHPEPPISDIRETRSRRIRVVKQTKPTARVLKPFSPPVTVVLSPKPELMQAPHDIVLKATVGEDVLAVLIAPLPGEYVEIKRPSRIRRIIATIARPFRW
jgi:hypothetical protein